MSGTWRQRTWERVRARAVFGEECGVLECTILLHDTEHSVQTVKFEKDTLGGSTLYYIFLGEGLGNLLV